MIDKIKKILLIALVILDIIIIIKPNGGQPLHEELFFNFFD